MTTETIDISKLDKSDVLVALFNNSRQQGLGFASPRGAQSLTKEEAKELLQRQTYFDYLHGRVMKVELGRDHLRPALYDRDNGDVSAARALEPLLAAAAA